MTGQPTITGSTLRGGSTAESSEPPPPAPPAEAAVTPVVAEPAFTG